MRCGKCDRDLTLCICEDIDERMKQLAGSPNLAIDWDLIRAERFLNKFQIQRDRAAAQAAKLPQLE